MEDIGLCIKKLLDDGYAEDVGDVSEEEANEVLGKLAEATGKNYMLQVNVNNERNSVYYDIIVSEAAKSSIRFEIWDL